MNKLIPLLSLVFLAAACDTPQRTRMTNPVSSNTSGVSAPTQTGTLGGGTTTTPTSPTTPTTPTTTAGFEACDLSAKYYASSVGYVGVCQSTSDETLFKIKPNYTDTSVRTCLIPIYKDASGSSTYLGQPQCTFTTAGVEVQGNLYKTRSVNGQVLPINGVFVMKERANGFSMIDEYLRCADGYTNFLAKACPNGSATNQACYSLFMRCPNGAMTNASCSNEAMSWRAQTCNSFKSNFGSFYIDIRTRN